MWLRPPQPRDSRTAAGAAEIPGGPFVALTFDDGPRASTTSVLLDGLSQRGVHATFFVIGQNVEGNEELLLRMEREGHQIGLHTYHHKALAALNAA
ncbi:MAG: polysaccharide deacetylase family protein, partial [Oscillospiraceae bacterium]|nr:polysaccharide deacetylase family protein [Oscillospiraceae bacterium]